MSSSEEKVEEIRKVASVQMMESGEVGMMGDDAESRLHAHREH